MYRQIIVGHDLHDGGDDALALGRELAEDGTVRRALGVLEDCARAARTEGGWRRVPVPTTKGLAPGTPDSQAQNENGHQPDLEEYAEAEIDRLGRKGLA